MAHVNIFLSDPYGSYTKKCFLDLPSLQFGLVWTFLHRIRNLDFDPHLSHEEGSQYEPVGGTMTATTTSM